MRAFVKKITWLSFDSGFGNGYVVIPKGHKLWGKHYDEIDVEVHGGLTFSNPADEISWPEIREEDKGGWVVGFDTCHLGDDLERWPNYDSVMEEATSLLHKLIAL